MRFDCREGRRAGASGLLLLLSRDCLLDFGGGHLEGLAIPDFESWGWFVGFLGPSRSSRHGTGYMTLGRRAYNVTRRRIKVCFLLLRVFTANQYLKVSLTDPGDPRRAKVNGLRTPDQIIKFPLQQRGLEPRSRAWEARILTPELLLR